MMIWYISKDYYGYSVLDCNGHLIGRIYRVRQVWMYEASNGTTRRLAKNLKKSLLMINMNVRWMEQLTHLEDLQ
jgi:hypothetical protein